MKTHMTVLDYFEQTGPRLIPGRLNTLPDNRNKSSAGEFESLLKDLGSARQEAQPVLLRGMSLSDYRAHAVKSLVRRQGVQTVLQSENSDENSAALENSKAKELPAGSKPIEVDNAERQKKFPEAGTGASEESTGRQKIDSCIENAALKYHLPKELIQSIIQAESNFRSNAVSRSGAVGLMQLMPGTARDLGVSDPFDVEQNIDGGARYLRQMMDRFDNDITLALAAYNAGPGAVGKYRGIPPYRETHRYIQQVLSDYQENA